ncbi:MAG TPA: hypothetical protein VN681_05740 [Stellaceae bacterium]|nr:hypothetical protein [Stellaceae bacterium]
MAQFRYTCARHRQMFIETVTRAGCTDPAEMDDLRRRLLAWLSARYPRMVLEHFEEATCLGCELEARFGDNGEIERLRRALEELVRTRTDRS